MRSGSGAGGETVTGARDEAGTGEIARGGETAAREGSVESREVVEGSGAEDGSAAGGVSLSPEVAGTV